MQTVGRVTQCFKKAYTCFCYVVLLHRRLDTSIPMHFSLRVYCFPALSFEKYMQMTMRRVMGPARAHKSMEDSQMAANDLTKLQAFFAKLVAKEEQDKLVRGSFCMKQCCLLFNLIINFFQLQFSLFFVCRFLYRVDVNDAIDSSSLCRFVIFQVTRLSFCSGGRLSLLIVRMLSLITTSEVWGVGFVRIASRED